MMVVVILGFFLILVSTVLAAAVIPQARELIGIVAGFDLLALVMLFILLLFGIGGSAGIRRGGRW
jgi:hypothetical protein